MSDEIAKYGTFFASDFQNEQRISREDVERIEQWALATIARKPILIERPAENVVAVCRALLAQDDALKQMTCLANKWYGYYESEFSVASDPLDHEWEDALWRARAAMLPREEVKDAISKR